MGNDERHAAMSAEGSTAGDREDPPLELKFDDLIAQPTAVPPPLPPAPPSRAGAPAAREEPAHAEALALVRACEAELAAGASPARAARLHHEIARLSEWPLGDLRRASAHYQEALARAPEHLPSIRGARRVLLARDSLEPALELFDAEARLTADPRRRAALLLARGRLLEDRLGRLGEARNAYAAGLELDRGDPSLLKALAQCDHASRAWASLTRTLERTANAVSADPRHRAALLAERAALAESRLGDAETAIALLGTALDLDPNAPGSLPALERLLHAERRWRELIDVLGQEAARTDDPARRAFALYRAGRLHAERLGNRDEAIAALERAAEATPDDPLILEELARLYEAAERWGPLVAVLTRIAHATDVRAERVARLHRLGTLCEDRLHAEDDAVRFHEEALSLDPTFVPSLQALGKLHPRRGAWEALVRMHLAEAGAVEDAPRRAAAHARVAEIVELQLGNVEEAAEHHARALVLAPGHPVSFKALARIYAALGRHRALVDLHERAIDGAPDPERAITALFKIAALHEDALGDPAQAAHAYRRVLSLDPGHLGAIHALQRVTERAGRWPEHVEALELESEKTRDVGQIVALLHRAGEVLDEIVGDRDAALVRFRKVLGIEPRYVPTLTALGRIYYRAGRWEDLLDMYGRELEVTPPGPRAVALRMKMGELCEERVGRDDEALAHYGAAAAMEPTSPAALRALARKLRERGDWAALVEVLETEREDIADPARRALAAYRLGEVCEERLAQPERAAALYEHALVLWPQCLPARAALSRLRAGASAWPAVVDELASEAATTAEPTRAVEALLRAGEVWRSGLDVPQRAIACFEAVLTRDPAHLGALLALESLYREVGDASGLERVLAQLFQTLTDTGARVAALRERARVQEAQHRDDARRATCEQILALAPDDPSALAALEALALATADAPLLARVDARRAATEPDPAVAAVHQTRVAEALEAQGDPHALEAFRAALRLDPESIAATRGFSRVAARTDDPEALAEAARREAAMSQSGDVAAQLLVRSAQLRRARLADTVGATADLERALELCPDCTDAAEHLAPLLAAEPARYVDVLARAADSAREPARQAALWRSVARLRADALDNVPGAIGALHRGLRSLSDDTATLQLLAELHERDAQWHEAAAVHARIADRAAEQDTRRDAHLALARIAESRLADTSRALVSLRAALALDPTCRDALRTLATLRARAGDPDAVRELVQRLRSAASNSDEALDATLLDARLAHERGDVAGALDTLCEALVAHGPSSAAGEAFRERLSSRADHERYATALATHLAHVDARGADTATHAGGAPLADRATAATTASSADAVRELARVLAGPLGRPGEALHLLEDAIAREPTQLQLREEFARRLHDAGRTEDARRELARLLADDVTRADTYRELARACDAQGRAEDARAMLQPLAVLGAARPDELARLAERPARPAQQRVGAFAAESLRTIEPETRHDVATALLATLPEAMGKLYPLDLEAYALTTRERIAPRSGHALRALCDQLAGIFGVAEYDLYVHRARGRGVSVELSHPVSLVVPAGLGDAPEGPLVFALARVFANIARDVSAIDKLTPREIEVVLASAVRQVEPSFGRGLTSEDFLDEQSRRIGRALSRRNRRALEELAHAYASAPPADFPGWVRSLHQTAHRGAVLVCDDLPGAVEVLRRSERDAAGLEGAALVRAAPAIADLLRFWCSEPALAARRRAGTLPPLPGTQA